MGLLVNGVPLDWATAQEFLEYVKKHGVTQFLNVHAQFKDRKDDGFLWGDEVEGHLVVVDKQTKTVKIALRAPELLKQLNELSQKPLTAAEAKAANGQLNHGNFLPEYGAWMVETTPARPYGGTTADLLLVQHNMRLRRVLINSLLGPNERYMTITSFPGMGVGEFTSPAAPTLGPVALSDYVPDAMISPHPRFATLTRNIRKRRGEKVCIRVPLFQDTHTAAAAAAAEARDGKSAQAKLGIADDKEIHMDAMGFGMGSCCLQVTFQTRSIDEGRHLYDQLAVLAPIMLALTAATPFLRGKIADTDVRWSVISQSVDDRTRTERSQPPVDAAAAAASDAAERASVERAAKEKAAADAKDSPHSHDTSQTPIDRPRRPSFEALAAAAKAGQRPVRAIGKSRYDSISTYISASPLLKNAYNDLPLVQNEETFAALKAAGIDDRLSRHIAHLFVRDPLVIYSDKIALDDTKSTDHFENIQSTNWQTVRFKPPPFASAAPAPATAAAAAPATAAAAPAAAATAAAGAANGSDAKTAGAGAAAGPAPAKSIGWRTEFRSMEVQLTDFENAAFTIFIAVLSRAILYFDLNLYIPISKVDENMKRAHKRDAVNTQKFFFRKVIKSCAPEPAAAAGGCGKPAAAAAGGAAAAADADVKCEYEEMTIGEIMCGKNVDCGCGSSKPSADAAAAKGQFPGLIPLARAYLDLIACDKPTRAVVDRYLSLIEQRANGDLLTLSAWYRKFVAAHPSYRHDSVLSADILYDVIETSADIASGAVEVPQLLGTLNLIDVYSLHPKAADGSTIHAAAGGDDVNAPVPLKGGGDRVFDFNDANGCNAFYAALKHHVHLHRPASAGNLAALASLPLTISRATSGANGNGNGNGAVAAGAAGAGAAAAGPMSPPQAMQARVNPN